MWVWLMWGRCLLRVSLSSAKACSFGRMMAEGGESLAALALAHRGAVRAVGWAKRERGWQSHPWELWQWGRRLSQVLGPVGVLDAADGVKAPFR